MILHAGLVACRTQGAWRGALIEGPSGAGKSDLALRLLEDGFRLVADDRTLVWSSAGSLFGRAPETLEGLLEIRGLGVLPEPALRFCEVALLAVCEAPERAPEPRWAERAGVRVPLLSLAPLEPSAPAKLRRAMEHLGAERKRAYLAPRSASLRPQSSGDAP